MLEEQYRLAKGLLREVEEYSIEEGSIYKRLGLNLRFLTFLQVYRTSYNITLYDITIVYTYL